MQYPTQHKQYKYLNFLLMFYMTIKLTTVVLIYKMITIGPFLVSASALIIPLWFQTGDVIAESYSYKIAKQATWIAIICQFIFAIICATFVFSPPPMGWPNQDAYIQVLGGLPKVTFASFIAIVTGMFINLYAISKWKILFRGKYFWLRSLGASAIGELVFTVIAYISEFFGVISWSNLFQLMLVSYVTKLTLNLILVIPATIIMFALKRLEKIDLDDININFNLVNINSNGNQTGNEADRFEKSIKT